MHKISGKIFQQQFLVISWHWNLWKIIWYKSLQQNKKNNKNRSLLSKTNGDVIFFLPDDKGVFTWYVQRNKFLATTRRELETSIAS